MDRKEICKGVHLNALPAPQFKRSRITLQLTMPAVQEEATPLALLSLVMERGYSDYPDMTQLSCRLAQLYGANMSVSTGMNGANRSFSVTVTGIRDEFALEGEALTAAYTELALGVLFRPYMPNGAFDEEAVQVEKGQLKETLLAEKNDKRGYCLRQTARRMFAGTPAAIEPNGTLEEVDGITPQRLTEVYEKLVREAAIEVFIMGADSAAVEVTIQAALAKVQRTPVALLPRVAMPVQPEVIETEDTDAEQGKLCLAFTLGKTPPVQEQFAFRLAMTVLGAMPTSRLFMNVREKKSLCYYCAPRFNFNTASVFIDSGIEPKNATAAKEAIMAELADLQNGNITQQEMDEAKRCCQNALRAVNDYQGGIESWYAGEIDRGTLQTPEQAIEKINTVTAQEVQHALQKMHLSVSYLLAKGESVNG